MSVLTLSCSLLFFAHSCKSKQDPLPEEDCCALTKLTLALVLFCFSMCGGVCVQVPVSVCETAAMLRWPGFLSIGAFTLQELSPCKEGACAGTSLSLSFLCRRLFSFILSLPLSLSAAAAWVLPAADIEYHLPHTHTLTIDIHTGTNWSCIEHMYTHTHTHAHTHTHTCIYIYIPPSITEKPAVVSHCLSTCPPPACVCAAFTCMVWDYMSSCMSVASPSPTLLCLCPQTGRI